jgi:hypothetical protein
MATAALTAQSPYHIFMFAVDDEGLPVRDLTPDDLRIEEEGQTGEVVSVQPFSWPVKVTVLVDNHLANDDGVGGSALPHLRSGLTEFFEALPRDVEVSLIATAPNPRWLVKPTTDLVAIRKGVGLITPEDFPARFADSLVEYAARLGLEFGSLTPEDQQPYLPVLVAVGSTAADASHVRRDPIIEMLTALRDYRVWTNFFMFTPGGRADINDGGNVLIAKAAQEITGGRYDALAKSASSSLNRLLPQLARTIAGRHVRQTTQYRILLERPATATGPLRDFQLTMLREGVSYQLSADGTFP